MSNLYQWIIVVQILLTSSGGLCGDDDREHVHIKVHIPEVHRKHTHFRKMQKHYFHPKKVVKMPEFLEAEMDNTPFNMMSYGMLDPGQTMQFSSFPMNMPTIPDLPYGVDNTLEATVMKKPKKNNIPPIASESSAVSKFHGMKKPSEFMGAHHADEIHKFTSPSEEDVSDDYGTGSSREAMVIDQRVAGSSYPYMPMDGSFKLKRPSYTSIFEHSVKPYSSGGIKWSAGLPSDWMDSTTEEDFSAFDRFVSPTTMHIAKAKPLSSSRLKFDRHAYERQPSGETMIAPRKKKPKAEKRHRTPSSGFRINY